MIKLRPATVDVFGLLMGLQARLTHRGGSSSTVHSPPECRPPVQNAKATYHADSGSQVSRRVLFDSTTCHAPVSQPMTAADGLERLLFTRLDCLIDKSKKGIRPRRFVTRPVVTSGIPMRLWVCVIRAEARLTH